jgi:acyl-CoA dehydrogenase
MSLYVSPISPRTPCARAGDALGSRDFIGRAEIVAAIAEQHADAVDREARFPAEAFAAIREQ